MLVHKMRFQLSLIVLVFASGTQCLAEDPWAPFLPTANELVVDWRGQGWQMNQLIDELIARTGAVVCPSDLFIVVGQGVNQGAADADLQERRVHTAAGILIRMISQETNAAIAAGRQPNFNLSLDLNTLRTHVRFDLALPLNLCLGDVDEDGFLTFADFLLLSTNWVQWTNDYNSGAREVPPFAEFVSLSTRMGSSCE